MAAVSEIEVESPLAVKLAENLGLIESRLEDIEKKYQELLNSKDNVEDKIGASQEGAEDKKNENGGSKAEDKEKEKNKADPELDPPTISELNYLTWGEWRKLRHSEAEWESKNDEQKTKDLDRGKARPKVFAIDVVADIGDLGYHPYNEKPAHQRTRLPGRIRINSEHIIEALNDVTAVNLQQPSQLLHPYKVIVDNLDSIRGHIKTLEDDVARKKTDPNAKSPPQGNHGTLLESHGETGKSQSGKESKIQSKSKPSKIKTEGSLELAQEKLKHYQLLIEVMDTDLAPEIEIAKNIRAGKVEKILFCHLWHLFPPGEMIYYQNSNRDEPVQAAQVLKVSGGRARLPDAPSSFNPWRYYLDPERYLQKYSPFTIDAFHLDFDGTNFRPIQVKYEIYRYTGEAPISSLSVFPLRFLPESNRDEIMQTLLKRGQNFRSLATVNSAHREYRGMSLDAEKEEIEGRVVVDFKSAPTRKPPPVSSPYSIQGKDDDEKNTGRIFGLRVMSQTKESEVTEVKGRYQERDLTLYNDHNYDSDKTDKLFLTNRVLLAPSQEMSSEDLTDEELRLLPGVVYAYVLRSRRYCKCDLTLIKEIEESRDPFEDLVLSEGYKKLIKSLVKRHSLGSRPVEQKAKKERPELERADSHYNNDANGHQDTLSIVKGKGRGLIILLHGVPGVGKSSTAETIAAATGRPLLPVTCGDIGENAADVEKNLEQIFTNSHRWGCVLLLDEAEVFLAKRNPQDLARNAMVSVFLRVLEFYAGILFLTTNRVGTIDEAFKSRIHISLYYPPLDWETTKMIWQVNLKRSRTKVDTDEDKIIRFAKKHYYGSDEGSQWNGRQIYNAFKTAIALAEFQRDNDGDKNQKPVLTAAHLKQIAKAAQNFDDYLLATQGGETIAAHHQQLKVRADAFGRGDAPPELKRRPTRSRTLDLGDLPSTSEDDSDVSRDKSGSSEETESEEDIQKLKRKNKLSNKTSHKRKEEGEKKSRKSKKSSKKRVDAFSDDSS